MNALKITAIAALLILLIVSGIICWGETEENLSVAELLENPVYNRDVKVEGVVSLLGELFCPCFHLSSGGKTLVAWYGLMIEDDGTQWNDVDVADIRNGDTVIVTGQLKKDGVYSSLNDFWAKNIVAKENDSNVEVTDPEEARDAALQYLSGLGIATLPDVSKTWDKEDVTPENIVGYRTLLYTSNEWSIWIQYPVVLPQNTVYQVEVVGPYTEGWYWKGSVSYGGQISEQIALGKLTVEISSGIARDFVVNSPTFKYDGILNTLELTVTNTLRCPYCWQFVFEFDCGHSGYGDRTGQVTLPVITHHQAVISVDHGQVVYALMDDQWDMITQELTG